MSYRAKHNISRQFTDSERAVDERVDEHLQKDVPAMPERFTGFGSSSQSYAWIKEDMANRANATQRLESEMSLANRQSIRHRLHNDAVEDSQLKNEAANALESMTNQVNNGQYSDMRDAISSYMMNNPGALANPHLVNSSKTISQFHRPEAQQKMDAIKKETEMSRAIVENFDAVTMARQYKDNPHIFEAIRKNSVEAGLADSQTKSLSSKIELIGAEADYKKSQDMLSQYGTLERDQTGGEALFALRSSSDEMGLGIKNYKKALGEFGFQSPQTAMLANHGWMKRRLDEDQIQQIGEAVNTITSGSSDPAKVEEAHSIIEGFTAKHYQEHREIAKIVESDKQYESIVSGVTEATDKLMKLNGEEAKRALSDKKYEFSPLFIARNTRKFLVDLAEAHPDYKDVVAPIQDEIDASFQKFYEAERDDDEDTKVNYQDVLMASSNLVMKAKSAILSAARSPRINEVMGTGRTNEESAPTKPAPVKTAEVKDVKIPDDYNTDGLDDNLLGAAKVVVANNLSTSKALSKAEADAVFNAIMKANPSLSRSEAIAKSQDLIKRNNSAAE